MFLGIDIGSTAGKAVLLSDTGEEVLEYLVLPTGWNSADTAIKIREELESKGYDLSKAKVIATGYGRISVPYADTTVTEISCHGQGVSRMFRGNCTVLDIGGQDTKIITLRNGKVIDFRMNDKCAAGTGRFLEVMANSLGVTLEELFERAQRGSGVKISSLCTVFAESEVISLVGAGRSRDDIAHAVCESIVEKVASLASKQSKDEVYFLSGGLCESDYVRRRLAETLKAEVYSAPEGRFAGALGAAILASKLDS